MTDRTPRTDAQPAPRDDAPELIDCPICGSVPDMRPGVCTDEIELHHRCAMGHIVNRGEFGDVWKTPDRVAKEWVKLCQSAETNRRADQPARAGMVKPLVWHDCTDGTSHDHDCQYEVEQEGKMWKLRRGVTGGTPYMMHCGSREAAKAAAQADYERRILAALLPTEAGAEPVAWQIKGTDGTWRYIEMPKTARAMGREIRPLYATPPAAPTDNTALVEALKRCLRVFEHHGLSGGLSSDIKDILAALSREAPQAVTVAAIQALSECISDMEAAGLNSPASAHAALRALGGRT